MQQLVDEAQVGRVVHLLGARAIGAARLLGQLVQEQFSSRALSSSRSSVKYSISDFRFMDGVRQREEIDRLGGR